MALLGNSVLSWMIQDLLCTDVGGPFFFVIVFWKSRGKDVLVHVYPISAPENSYFVYALFDDQSNRTLARSQLFDIMYISDHSAMLKKELVQSCDTQCPEGDYLFYS